MSFVFKKNLASSNLRSKTGEQTDETRALSVHISEQIFEANFFEANLRSKSDCNIHHQKNNHQKNILAKPSSELSASEDCLGKGSSGSIITFLVLNGGVTLLRVPCRRRNLFGRRRCHVVAVLNGGVTLLHVFGRRRCQLVAARCCGVDTYWKVLNGGVTLLP
jgi:hypothetical protein